MMCVFIGLDEAAFEWRDVIDRVQGRANGTATLNRERNESLPPTSSPMAARAAIAIYQKLSVIWDTF